MMAFSLSGITMYCTMIIDGRNRIFQGGIIWDDWIERSLLLLVELEEWV